MMQPCYCMACEINRKGLIEGIRPWVAPWALKLVEEDLKAVNEQQ